MANQPVDNANNILQNHPELAQKSPQIAADLIHANADPSTALTAAASQTVAAHAQAVIDHQNTYHSQSVWASILGGAEGVMKNVVGTLGKVPGVGQVMQWANKPLQEIQRDYKFIHSVYTDHGFFQGTLAALGVAGGAAAGFVGSGFNPLGAVVGADVTAAAERNLAKLVPSYQDSIKKSEDANYLISPGRDFANLISNVPGFAALKDTQRGWGQTISGVTDAVFDFSMDPVIKAGTLKSQLKTGKYVGAAVDADGKTIFNESGQPASIRATLPIASQFPAINNFIVSYSGKALNSGQVRAAYDNILNKPFRTAVDTIAKTSNPVEIQRLFPNSQFTMYEAKKLAEATTANEVLNEMGKSLYSSELVSKDYLPRTTLILPTQTIARQFAGKGLEALRQRGTTINEERNLLLPKTVSVVDENGDVVLNANGSIQKQQLMGALPSALAKLGKFDITGAKDVALNGIAGKVRTFTGYKALSVNAKTLEQSGKNFSWEDPNLGPQLYNMAMYTMPHDLALEHVSKIMLEEDLALKQNMYSNLVKETVKAAGLSANDAIVEKVMSQAQRSTTNGELAHIQYGNDVKGAPRGTVETVDGRRQGVALWSWQRGENAFIDFKELRKSMRETTIHSLLYQKANDWFTFYTDKVFAPLTLFTSGFGLRVASSEALHQIIRAGLGDYLQTQVAQSASKYNILHKLDDATIQRYADSAAQALTEEDHTALLSGNKVVDNSITKLLKQKAELYKSLGATEVANELATDLRDLKNRIHPVGFVTSKMAPYVAKEKLDVVTKYQQLMGHVGIPAGVASDHGKSFKTNAEDRVDIIAQLTGHGSKPTEEIASLTGTNPHYHQYWALNLSKLRNEQMARDIAKDWQKHSASADWDALSNDEKWARVQADFEGRVKDLNQYKDIRPTMLGLTKAKPESYANEVVSSFRGLVEGASGKIHEDLINNIATKQRTYEGQLKDISTEDSPFAMLGKAHKPGWSNPYERILDTGYRTFVNPIIDHISREPIFAHYMYENYRDMKPLLDKGFSEDSILRMAGQKATIQMLPLIHNPALRSQWAVLSRNIFPFYFAQEQAMKRVGRLAMQDGRSLRAFREFQMIHQGINNPGFVHTDSSGKQYIVYPLLGEFGNSLVRGMSAMGMESYSGLPMSVTGNTVSLMTVLPEAKVPSVNPFGNLLVTEVGKRFPWTEKATSALSGGFPATDWMSTVLPNSAVRSIWNGLTMDQRVNAVHNATLSAIASAQFHGIIDENFAQLPASAQQQIIDKIENNAKSNLFVQGLFSFFLPLSPSVSNTDMNKDLKSLRSEFLDMVKAEQAKGNKDAFATAKEQFFAEHGNQAVSYTVGWSQSGTSGAQIPLSDTTVKWLDDNKNLINKYQNGAAYLIPQNTQGGDVTKIENKLLAMHLRAKETPQEFINSVYVQKGWVDLGDAFKQYQEALKTFKQTNDVAGIANASQMWNQMALNYGMSNPIWYASYKDPVKNIDAQNSLKDLQGIQASGGLSVSPQGSGIEEMLKMYDYYHEAIALNTKGTKLTSQGYQIMDMWNTYLDGKIATNPELTNVVNGVFRKVK